MRMVSPAASFSSRRTSAFTGRRNEPEALSGKIEVVHWVLPVRAMTGSLPQPRVFGSAVTLIYRAISWGRVTKCQPPFPG